MGLPQWFISSVLANEVFGMGGENPRFVAFANCLGVNAPTVVIFELPVV